jgi:hypothetical protein
MNYMTIRYTHIVAEKGLLFYSVNKMLLKLLDTLGWVGWVKKIGSKQTTAKEARREE